MANTRIIDVLLERGERVDRRQLEDFLRGAARESSILRKALGLLDTGIVIIDKNLRIIEINPSAEFILGIAARKVKERKIIDCPIDPALLQIIEKRPLFPENICRQELYVTFPREQLLRVILAPIKEQDEEDIFGWVFSLQDISEFTKTSAQKTQTEKLRAVVTMAGILAHELGNPLNSLSIHLQLVDKAVKKIPEKYRSKISKFLKITRGEVKRLDDIVTRFLQAARPFKPRFFEGDINRIISETLQLMGPELKKNKFIIKKNFSKDLPWVYVDHIQIRQVIINIIKNAIEAKPEKPKLEIETAVSENKIKVSFGDNGAGIPEDELKKVFEPYFSTKRGGSGLGLMILNRIIRDHGGTVEIESKISEGTTVIIYLPTGPIGPKLITAGK